MKKLIYISLLCFLFISSKENLYTQSGWVIQSTSVTDDLYAIYFANPFTGYAAGENGRMIKTTNGGLNWFVIGAGVTNQFLQVIQFFDANTGYVSGNWTGSVSNNFWKTTNGGVNWTQIGTLSPDRMQFINLNLGWSIINQGLSKTTNGGTLWSSFSFDPVCPSCSMNDIYFHSQDTGYTAGDYWNSSQNMGYVHIFKTTNGGTNWNLKFIYQSNSNPYAPQLGHFFFPKPQMQTGYAMGSYEIYAGLYKTTNYGENWAFKKQFQYQANFQWFTGINTGWITSTQGKIMFTSDGGSNFIVYTTSTTNELNRIFFINDSTGWIAGNNGIILAKNNGFSAPAPPVLVSPPNGSFNQPTSIRFIWNKSLYATSYRLQIARDSLFTIIVLNDSAITDSTLVFSGLLTNTYFWWRVNAKNPVGTSPYSAVWKFGTFPVGLIQIGSDVPDKFEIYNNYPNPFNPSTTIKFDIPKSSHVQIVVYDMLGREVEQLLNEARKPGSYEVTWDGSKYSSGVYFYKVITDEYVETKKMLMIK